MSDSKVLPATAALPKWEAVGEGILAIDTDYVRPRMDASHLIIDNGRAAFIDTGTNTAVPNLLAALESQHIERSEVDYILLTHVHLDHAGGVGLLARALPRARILVHPRGAAHIIDPGRLIAGTRDVYGESEYSRLYGDILPVTADRVSAVAEGERVRLGNRYLEFMYTPGHALHHVCIVDHAANAVFSGDTFGVSYRELDTARGQFIFATTTPSQFDPVQLHASIDRLLARAPAAIFLTHYSRVTDVQRMGVDLHADIERYVGIAKDCAEREDRLGQIRQRLFAHLSARLDAHGSPLDDAERHAVIDMDVQLNSAGLDIWLSRTAS